MFRPGVPNSWRRPWLRESTNRHQHLLLILGRVLLDEIDPSRHLHNDHRRVFTHGMVFYNLTLLSTRLPHRMKVAPLSYRRNDSQIGRGQLVWPSAEQQIWTISLSSPAVMVNSEGWTL